MGEAKKEENVMAKIKSDLEWEARNDVDTLIKAKEILADAGRKKRALTEIEKRDAATAGAKAELERKTSERMKKTFSK